MAYLDMLSAGSYGRFNRKLASLTDITTAVYWSEILDICTKVLKKKKFDNDGYFKLDRKYIETRCNINLDQQLACDGVLEKLYVLKRSETDPNMISVCLENYEKFLICDDVKKLDLSKEINKLSREQKAANKKAAIIITMKRLISEQDPDLKAKYESWIDSVYETKYFLTRDKIQIFESAINEYTNDKQVKSDILTEAILSGFTEPAWVINRYESNKKNKPSRLPAQKIGSADQICTEWEF